MIDLTELEKESRLIEDQLNKISEDIRAVENFLKKSPIPSFHFIIPGGNDELLWDSEDKRLKVCLFRERNSVPRPLFESNIATRVLAHKYLQNFIDEMVKVMKEKAKERGLQ